MIKQLLPQHHFIPARIILFLLAVVAAMADGRKRPWDQKKRHSCAAGSSGAEGIEMVDLRAAHDEVAEERRRLLLPLQSEGVYNMRVSGEKERLARDLWQADFSASMLSLREQNVQLVQVLLAKFCNLSHLTPAAQKAAQRHIDGVLLDVCRAQNMFKIPLLIIHH